MTLPVAHPWYETQALSSRLWLITEPHVHPIFSANMHLVLGRDADLLIDSGMGVAPLRPVVDALRGDPAKPLICLSTHTHVDHIGAAHEFDMRLVHPIEAAAPAAPAPYSLISADIPAPLAELFLTSGYPELWPLLIDALPHADYDPASYELKAAPATGTVEDGQMIDLGDWQAEVLHLPGHSPGQVGVWHAPSGTLFGADAVYDGPLICDGPGMSIDDYAATLKRLRGLPVQTVHGGHDPAFGAERLHQIVDDYLTRWGMS
jgi:glyoxylase-like metal-dependent hydrolase (beta-lactamase superfamily II)